MRIFAAALLACALIGSAHAQEAAPDATVAGFYGAYKSFHPSDGIPDAKGRARYEPFLSPALNRALVAAAAAEDKFAKANKDSPPLIEGDLFTSNFEGATEEVPQPCRVEGAEARCPVQLTYTGAKAKPLVWTDTLLLVKTEAGWRVDDIAYGGNWDFGNKGRLSDTLRQTAAMASD